MDSLAARRPGKKGLGGRPSVLPSDEDLLKLYESSEDMTYPKIAAIYGVTPQAVGKRIKAAREGTKASTGGRYTRLMPWQPIRDDHGRTYVGRMVALYAKVTAEGAGAVTRNEESMLNDFLAELDKNNLVVRYRYEDDKGWGLRQRRPDDDPDVIWVAQ